jgi:hypothetical protein
MKYGLGDNPDVLFSFADALYAGFRWADCFAITERSVLTLFVLELLVDFVSSPIGSSHSSQSTPQLCPCI